MEKPSVTIIGLGNVGTALLNVLPEAGYKVISAYTRSEADSALKKIHPAVEFNSGLPLKKEETGELIIITVSDDAIRHVCEEVAAHFKNLENRFVIHCSGTHSSGVLNSARQKGAKTASFHPIKAITKKTGCFSDIWFDMEGDEKALGMLEKMAQDFGAEFFRVKPEAKPFLHASAVMASNYLVVLSELVARISSEAEIDEETALKAFLPLMKNTLTNIANYGPADALTGPIARGDVETIRDHIKILKNNPEVLSLYKQLGTIAVALAQKKSGDTPSLDEMKDLLS